MTMTTFRQEVQAGITRQAMRRMRRAVLASLLHAGYAVTIDNGKSREVWEERDMATLMAKVQQGDADMLLCHDEEGECQAWVLLTYGGKAHELVADHTSNLEEVLAPVWTRRRYLELLDL